MKLYRNFANLWSFLKFHWNFGENIWEKLRKLWNYGFLCGSGAELPELAKILKTSRKINGNPATFLKFPGILAKSYVSKLILIKIKGILQEYRKYWIILKEIKKPRGKSLHVLARNQLRFETFEIILKFRLKNLIAKLIFYPFSLR